MKTIFKIIGILLGLVLVTGAMYVALVIGFSYYIAWGNQMRGRAYALAHPNGVSYVQPSQAEAAPSAAGPLPNKGGGVLPPAPPPQSSLFVDPAGFKNEDNWLATTISREIAGMALFASHPHQPLPNFAARAEVDPSAPKVQVAMNGIPNGGDGKLNATLTPSFAWDPAGYAPLAAQLLGTAKGIAPEPDGPETDVLKHLLQPTASGLAVEDMRVSNDLQQHPTSWQDHEQAAVVLTALAMREQAGEYGDSRTFLSRATAHLALANALRGDQPASWPGLIADAAARTLAGREVDALAHLDALAARADCPEAAKTWIAVLRTLAKEDWREAAIAPESPLLLKIAWFKVFLADTSSKVAMAHLQKIVLQPPVDPNVPPDQSKTNPETLVADWARIAGRSPYYEDADDPAKNAEYKLDLEFHELDEILTIEHGTPFSLDKLADVFSQPQPDTVANDNSGKPAVRVVGPGTFAAATLRHLFSDIPSRGLNPDDPQADQASLENFCDKMDVMFKGVPGYEIVQYTTKSVVMMEERKTFLQQLETDKKTWPVWQAPHEMTMGLPGHDLVEAFYARAVPFGTVYNPGQRMPYIQSIGAVKYPQPDPVEMARMKALPIDEQVKEIGEYNKKFNESLRKLDPKEPSAFEKELTKLDPDNYALATDHIPTDKLMAVAPHFFEYIMAPSNRMEYLDSAHLDDATRESFYRRQVELDPTFYLSLCVFLRAEGKESEAAEAARQGFKEGDPTTRLQLAEPLVDYDLDHGLMDEAMDIGKKVSTDLSWGEIGMDTYFDALEGTGRLDEAKIWAKKITEAFDDTWPEIVLYSGHSDRFPEDNAAEKKRIFPDGIQKADLTTFSGPPTKGFKLDAASTDQWTDFILKPSHLQRGDIMVALDGYRIDTAMQYFFIQALGHGPDMNFIVWRDGKYQEVKAYVPHRRFMLPADQVQGP
jgi:hypothetical protein